MSRIKLSADLKEQAIREIRLYFEKERGEEIGELAAELFLDFIEEKMGAYFYNQGVYDAQLFISEKTDELLMLMK